MLGTKDAMATVAVRDLDAAKKFYEQTLGLKRVAGAPAEAPVYQAGKLRLLVYQSKYAGTNQATAVTWDAGEDVGLSGVRRGAGTDWVRVPRDLSVRRSGASGADTFPCARSRITIVFHISFHRRVDARPQAAVRGRGPRSGRQRRAHRAGDGDDSVDGGNYRQPLSVLLRILHCALRAIALYLQ